MLRRLEYALKLTRDTVLTGNEARKVRYPDGKALGAKIKAKQSFYNSSKYTLTKLMAGANNIRKNLESYINNLSPNTRDIFEKYEFTT
ncbi:MAG: hypothetical protein KAH20_10095 [Methylococcales bacterium]|nr:hypothetical protein [Methylococcales bacterium]